jgi:hypothetical protein
MRWLALWNIKMLDKATKHYLWLLFEQTFLGTWLSTAVSVCFLSLSIKQIVQVLS